MQRSRRVSRAPAREELDRLESAPRSDARDVQHELLAGRGTRVVLVVADFQHHRRSSDSTASCMAIGRPSMRMNARRSRLLAAAAAA